MKDKYGSPIILLTMIIVIVSAFIVTRPDATVLILIGVAIILSLGYLMFRFLTRPYESEPR